MRPMDRYVRDHQSGLFQWHVLETPGNRRSPALCGTTAGGAHWLEHMGVGDGVRLPRSAVCPDCWGRDRP